MPLRMLVYLVRIWERHRKENDGPLPPIIPVVVSHAPGGWTAARAFEDLFDPHPTSIPGLAELTPRFSLVVEDLAHVTNDDLKARALAAFPKLVLWAMRDARNTDQLLANLGHWGAAFKEALRTPHGMEAVRLLMRYIALVSDDLHLDQFRAKDPRTGPRGRGSRHDHRRTDAHGGPDQGPVGRARQAFDREVWGAQRREPPARREGDGNRDGALHRARADGGHHRRRARGVASALVLGDVAEHRPRRSPPSRNESTSPAAAGGSSSRACTRGSDSDVASNR